MVYENKDWNFWIFGVIIDYTDRCKSGLRKQGLKLNITIHIFFLYTSLQKWSTKTRIETIFAVRGNSISLLLQKWSTKTRIETFNSTICISNFITCCKSGLRKQGLKQHRCQYKKYCRTRCKSGLRKQGLKRLWNMPVLYLHGYLQVAKVVYENKDWNQVLTRFPFTSYIVAKGSKKTRIETSDIFVVSLQVSQSCKRVYENKDWNASLICLLLSQ